MIHLPRPIIRAARQAASLVLPHQCVLCRRFAESTGLCATCWDGLAPIGAPVCRQCGLPLGHTLADPVCATCFQTPPPLDMIRAALHYNDSSRQLILAFKHGDGLQLTPFLAALMAHNFRTMTDMVDTERGGPLVVPVPLHRRRFFRRRYNQSAELARHLCRINAACEFAPQILVRQRPTRSQGGLSRRQRHRNLAGAFATTEDARAMLKGRAVILVDDVMTTGATLFAAARCLSAGGSGAVSAIVLARVARPHGG